MSNLLVAPAILSGLGLIFSTALAVANRYLRVEEDPRVEAAEGLLPGSNCGACGQAGCHAFAERLVQGQVKPSGCTVASPAAVEALAELLDVDAGQQERRLARLHCAGGRGQAYQIAEYQGFESCLAATVVSEGGKGCAWGCLGLGDCRDACTFGAIAMSTNGLPVVAVERCTACGDCVRACPRGLFELMPLSHHLIVQCRAPLKGELAVSLCTTACDACGRCAADAAPGLIRMEDNLPVVDYGAGGPARPEATYRCPTGAIEWVVGPQFQEGAPPRSRPHAYHA
jgi:RnfABCDGE-type electron transport complex B subunit